MLIYKSKYLNIWRTQYKTWRVWIVMKEYIIIGLGSYRVGICWRPSVYGDK